jgi:hypothetical protein
MGDDTLDTKEEKLRVKHFVIINVKPKIYSISCIVSEITTLLNMYSIRQKNWHNQS